MLPRKTDLPQGTLDMLILKSLSLGQMHGYGIGQRIQQLTSDMLQVEEGSLYPALYRIERRGWIRGTWGVSDNGRKARFYTLTRQGRKQLAIEESNWEFLTLAITKLMQAT
jgi:PadR family transcriptional regulator, regulatory protein PadR